MNIVDARFYKMLFPLCAFVIKSRNGHLIAQYVTKYCQSVWERTFKTPCKLISCLEIVEKKKKEKIDVAEKAAPRAWRLYRVFVEIVAKTTAFPTGTQRNTNVLDRKHNKTIFIIFSIQKKFVLTTRYPLS